MKFQYIFLSSLICMAGCTTAFEIGESLNKATTNIANDPKVLWSTVDPVSAPEATTSSEPTQTPPKEEAK